MKPVLFLLCFIFVIFNSCNTSKKPKGETSVTQNDNQTIRSLLKQYNDYTIKENYEALIGFIHPDAVGKYSKEKMMKEIKDGMHNDDYDIRISNIYIDSISDIITNELNRYAVAKTRTDGTFMIKGGVLNDSVKRSNLYDRFCSDFKSTYGEANVKCEDHSKSVSVVMKNEAYLIFSNKYDKWFVLGDAAPKEVEKFIPLEVRRKLNISISY